MANKLLHTKQTKSKISNHFFASNVGSEAEINIISMASKGAYLTAKAGGQWHSVRLKPAQKVDDGDFTNLTISGDAVFQKGKVLFQKGWTSLGDVYIRGSKKLYMHTSTTTNITGSGDSIVYSYADTLTESLTMTLSGDAVLDKDFTGTATATEKVLYLDFDAAGVTASGQTATNIGLDLDLNTDGPTMVGNVNNTGIDIDLVAGTSGVQTNTGIAIDVDGADTNTGLLINTAGTHIKLEANADVNDYATFVLADTGDLTIATVGSGTTDSDLTLDVDGDIELNADGGQITIKDGSDSHFLFDCDNTRFRILDDTNVDDHFTIVVGAEGTTTLLTTDADTTVAHLTLQPDGDLVLDPVSQKTIINATDGLYFDGGGDTYIKEGAADRLDFYVGGTLLLQIVETTVDAVHINCNLSINAASKLWFDGSVLGHTYIQQSSDDVLDFYVGTDKMLALDEANDKITMGATNWVAGTVSGGTVTEFSAANSSYAGMILGYTCIGANVADDSYTLTTSFVPFQDSGGTSISVTFKTPPSEYVEIEAELYFSAGSGASDLELTLSDNAVYGGNSLTNPLQFDKSVREPARGHSGTVTQKWFLQANNLAAIGSSNTIYIAAKCDSTSGTPIIRWGGDASGEYTNLVMKAVALPAAIVEGS